MKVYLANGSYFEKQADARAEDRKFETIDFPFGASPKSDFIDWLNDGLPGASGNTIANLEGLDDPEEELPVDRHVRDVADRQKPEMHEPRAPRTADAIEEWVLDEATPAEIEQLFVRLGTRFHEMRKETA